MRDLTPPELLYLGRAARKHFMQSVRIRQGQIYYERDLANPVGYVCIDIDTGEPIAVDMTCDRDMVFARFGHAEKVQSLDLMSTLFSVVV